MYDGNSYPYPAYVTNDGFSSTYEYALIDRDGGRIVYIYAAYVMPDGFKFKSASVSKGGKVKTKMRDDGLLAVTISAESSQDVSAILQF